VTWKQSIGKSRLLKGRISPSSIPSSVTRDVLRISRTWRERWERSFAPDLSKCEMDILNRGKLPLNF